MNSNRFDWRDLVLCGMAFLLGIVVAAQFALMSAMREGKAELEQGQREIKTEISVIRAYTAKGHYQEDGETP